MNPKFAQAEIAGPRAYAVSASARGDDLMGATAISPESPKLASVQASKILVVDDEEIIRVLLTEILIEDGYEVTTAASGEEAVQLLEGGCFDLLISDMVMPGMNGIEVLQAAFQTNPHQATIMITGYPSVDTAVRLVSLGAADYITKPFNVDMIKVTVAKVLAQFKAGRRAGAPDQSGDSLADAPAIDGVTKAYNLRLFNQLLEVEIGRSQRRRHTFSLLVAEIDGFDKHSAGGAADADALVSKFAELIRSHARPGDIIGRLDAAQLALLMPETDPADAEAIANRARKSIGWDFSISGGIAVFPRNAGDAHALLKAARAAMQSARTRGGDAIAPPR